MRQPIAIRSPIPFFRNRLPHGFAQGISQRPVPNAAWQLMWCDVCHTGAWQHKCGRLPRAFAEGISQRPVPNAVWQRKRRDGCHTGAWQHKRRRLPRAFAKGISQRPVPNVWQLKRCGCHAGRWQRKRRDGCHTGRVAAHAKHRLPSGFAQAFPKGRFPTRCGITEHATAATRARGSSSEATAAARGAWQASCGSREGAFGGRCAARGGRPQGGGGEGGRPLARDTDFENSHKNCAHIFAQIAMRNRLGRRPYSKRRGDPHPRAVKVIACGAARRRRPAAIPSGRGRLRGIRADYGGSPHTRLCADRLRQPWARAFPSRTLPIQGRHDTPPLPPLMPLQEPDAAPLHTVTPTLRLLAAAGYRLCHARCTRRG